MKVVTEETAEVVVEETEDKDSSEMGAICREANPRDWVSDRGNISPPVYCD